MRPLIKNEVPDVLVKKSAEWTAELAAALDADGNIPDRLRSRYNHPQIKNALLVETDGKCAYCESKVRHVTYGDIEHVIPKSKVPALSFEWSNLTIACDVCNTNKGDHYSEDAEKSDENIIDPYIDRIEDHLLFAREIIAARPDSMKALATEQKLQLNRNYLVERRRERLDFLDGLVRAYHLGADNYKAMLLKQVHKHIGSDSEYVGSAHSHMKHLQRIGAIPNGIPQ